MALRKCKDCGKEISKRADSCPHCGAPIRKTSLFTWIVTIIIGLVIIGAITEDSTTLTTSDREQSESKAKLEIQSFNCNTEHGYHSIVGEVKNVSPSKIDNVMAVGVFVTRSGEVVKTQNTLIEYNPIMPGQISPFKVLTTANPQITNCKLSFKNMFGGEILSK